MKLATLALYSILGVSVAASAGYVLASRKDKPQVAQGQTEAPPLVGTEAHDVPETKTSFTAGTTLQMEGRIGHAVFPKRDDPQKTFLLLEVRPGQTDARAKPVEGHLAIVIDRSGSMKGDRLPKALAAAKAAVDQLNIGDRVSVISFDTEVIIDVPMVTVSVDNREKIKSAIDQIKLGGDTCISCGIGAGLTELGWSGNAADRMILLSDGEPTAGARDEAAFAPIMQRAREAGVGITTIGVGTSYNHKIMGAIALASSGNHYFVEDPTSLERAFLAEADKLKATVALSATATITLEKGVTLERVYDRSFERKENQIIVPLGNVSVGDTRTVLVELSVPTSHDGIATVAKVDLSYDDRVLGAPGRCEGHLEIAVKDKVSAVSELDPQVATRLARSQTAATLQEVNALIEQGRTDEAEAKIAAQQKALEAAAEKAKNAKSERAAGDLATQSSSLKTASEGLGKKGGTPAPKPRTVRKNVEMMNPFML